MTLPVVTPRKVIAGTGTRGPFSLVNSGTPIRVRNASDLVVYRYAAVTDDVGVLLVLNTDYTVDNTNVDAATLTLAMSQAVLASTQRLVVDRKQDIASVLELISGGDFSAAALGAAISVLSEQMQEVRAGLNRAVKVSWRDSAEREMPVAPASGDAYIFQRADGTFGQSPTEAIETLAALAAAISQLAAIISDIQTVADADADIAVLAAIASELDALGGSTTQLLALHAALTQILGVYAVRTAVSTVAGISAEVAALGAISTELGALYAIRTDLTAVEGISGDVTAVAAVASSVGALGGITAELTALNGALSSISTLAGLDTEIAALGLVSGSLATLAAIDDDISTVANLSASIPDLAGVATEVGALGPLATELAALHAVIADISDLAPIAADISALGPLSAAIGVVNTISSAVSAVGAIAANVTAVAGVATEVAALGPVAAELTGLHGALADITAILAIVDEVTDLGASVAQVVSLAEIRSELVALYNELTAIQAVGANAASVVQVAGVADHVAALGPIASQLEALGDEIASVLALVGSVDNLAELAPVASAMASLAPVATEIGELAPAVAGITALAPAADALVALEGAADEIVEIAGDLPGFADKTNRGEIERAAMANRIDLEEVAPAGYLLQILDNAGKVVLALTLGSRMQAVGFDVMAGGVPTAMHLDVEAKLGIENISQNFLRAVIELAAVAARAGEEEATDAPLKVVDQAGKVMGGLDPSSRWYGTGFDVVVGGVKTSFEDFLAALFELAAVNSAAFRAAIESATGGGQFAAEEAAGPGWVFKIVDRAGKVMGGMSDASRLMATGIDLVNAAADEGFGEVIPLVTDASGRTLIGATRTGQIVIAGITGRSARADEARDENGRLYSLVLEGPAGQTLLGLRWKDGTFDFRLSELTRNLAGVNHQTPRLRGWAGASGVRQDGDWTWLTAFDWDGLPYSAKQGVSRPLIRRGKITTAITPGQGDEPMLVILVGGQSLAGFGAITNEYLAAGALYPAHVFHACDSAGAAIVAATSLSDTPANMADAVDLRPMENTGNGTYPAAILAQTFEYLHRLDAAQAGGASGPHDFPQRRTGPGVVGFTAYVGGEKIESFEEGSDPYAITIAKAEEIKAIANAYGRSVRFAYVWIHGEAGALSGDYAAHLSDLMDAYRTDLDAIADGGQTLLFVSQIGLQDEQATPIVDSSDDQIAYLMTSPTRVYSGGPQHPGRLYDAIHYDFDGRVLCNEARAHLIYEAVKGRPRAPLVPVCVRTGSSVVCTFPESTLGPLTLDTDWMPAITNHNVGWDDAGDGNSVTVSAVAITGVNTVTVTLSDTPTGTAQILRWGQNVHGETTADGWSNARIPIYRATGIKSLAQQVLGTDGPEDIRHYVMRGDFAVTT